MQRLSPEAETVLCKAAGLILALDEERIGAVEAVLVAACGPLDANTIAVLHRVNRLNILHWARETQAAPHRPVPANLSIEMLETARFQARMGLDDVAERAYRAGQQAAWLEWMQIVFSLTSDPAILQQVLDFSARSVSAFVEATISGLAAQVEAEHREMLEGSHGQQRRLVQAFLEGQPIHPASLSRKLGYRLDGPQWAAVLWTERPEGGLDAREAWLELRARIPGLSPVLAISPDRATIWLWSPSPFDGEALIQAAPAPFRLAMGPEGQGPEGFQSSHRLALVTQRILMEAPEQKRLAAYRDIRILSLLTTDRRSQQDFLRTSLGPLRRASPAQRGALRAYLRSGCNMVEAARSLGLHRNTLMRHLARAEDLLPGGLSAETRLDVALALEILEWRKEPGQGGEP